jgi:hypothetical protein
VVRGAYPAVRAGEGATGAIDASTGSPARGLVPDGPPRHPGAVTPTEPLPFPSEALNTTLAPSRRASVASDPAAVFQTILGAITALRSLSPDTRGSSKIGSKKRGHATRSSCIVRVFFAAQ